MATDPLAKVALDCLDLFKVAFAYCQPYFRKAEMDAAAYEGNIDRAQWPCLSELVIPAARTAVEQTLASVMPYLLPENQRIFEQMPVDEELPFELVERMTDYTHYVLRRRMDLYARGLLTLKDVCKLGTGYGIVEAKTVTPPRRQQTDLIANGQMTSFFSMEQGAPELMESYRYVPFASVMPTPDGDQPDNVSCVFHLDFYNENDFRALYEDNSPSKDDMVGSAGKFIEMARSRTLNGYVAQLPVVMASIAGVAVHAVESMRITGTPRNVPVLVPVLKCYYQREHVWLACGSEVMYRVKDKYSTLRCPIVKGSAYPNGGNWFNPGIIGAAAGLPAGINLFWNSIIDLLDIHLHPPTIVDTNIIPEDQAENFGPYAKIFGHGPIDKAIKFWSPESISPQLFAMGEKLESMHSDAVGQPAMLRGEGPAGLLRGGSGAFESLLSTTTAREKLLGTVLETGWLQQVINNTLIVSQSIVNETGAKFVTLDEKADGERRFKQVTITADDLRHVMAVTINAQEKIRNQAANVNLATQFYGLASRSPNYNLRELDKWLAEQVGGESLRRKLLTGANKQERMGEIAAMNGGGEPGMTQGQQALAGGSSQVTGGNMG